MGVYASDGELYAGWSTGRWFGLIALVGLIFSFFGWQMLHGWLALSLDLPDQMIAVFMQYVGGGMFCLMSIAALGSVMVSRAERGDIEVSSEGVTRTFAPGKVKFFPRAQIAGLVSRPGGGVALLDERRRTLAVVSRSLMDYRGCIAELKAMGIPHLPPTQAVPASVWKPENWKERIQLWGVYGFGAALFSRGNLVDHLVGAALSAAWLGWVAIDYRKDPVRRRRWVQLAGVLAAYGVGFAAIRMILIYLRH